MVGAYGTDWINQPDDWPLESDEENFSQMRVNYVSDLWSIAGKKSCKILQTKNKHKHNKCIRFVLATVKQAQICSAFASWSHLQRTCPRNL